ncbi:MAG: DNA methyltransferase, partial [Ilumatobacteraceae bacterium]|nr:DNA methyltransferase [Ilumatobacteraceae bacterium]
MGTLPSMSDVPNYGENAPRIRRSTSTSAFGASKREGHDASAFYARFRTPDISADETLADPLTVDPVRNQIFVGDSRDMSQIPDNSVGLVVTSPPYFAGKAYEEALGEGHIPADYVKYLEMLTDVFAECRRVLEPGGRIVVNVANLGRRPFRSLASDITTILQDELGLLLRGEVVWLKQRGSSGSCAWGSFRS